MTSTSPATDPTGSGTAPSPASTPVAPSYPGTPRWVKLGGIALLLIVLVFGGLHLAGRGMGPMNHMPPAGGN